MKIVYLCNRYNLKMKLIAICLTFIYFVQAHEGFLPRHGLPPPDPPKERAASPAWGTIIQRQDNFNALNTNTYQMRFLSNGQFFRTGGPIFIMLGAEWTIDAGWLQSGQMYDMASTHGAYMFYTEHRYYGSSYPTRDLSSPNLKYLSVDQALADVANFIVQIKNKNPNLAYSKVVVFGGSYGGTMAMWMREKYPNLVHAAVSSSAPLLAKVDFHEYYDVVQKNLGAKCASIISNGVQEILWYLQQGNSAKIQKDFNTCELVDQNNFLEVATFFLSMSARIGGLIQYAQANTISDLCNSLESASYLSDYERLANYFRGQNCISGYKNLVYYYSQTGLNLGNSRQWIYQTCTEFAFFQTSWSYAALFRNTIPVDYYQRWCLDFFGSSFTPSVTNKGVENTNKKYGALQPSVTRVVSVHGTVDPWHALGLSQSGSSQTPVIIVPGTSHCADLSSLSSRDPPEMINAKRLVQQYVAKWLQEP